MSKVSLPTAVSGYNLQTINNNFATIASEFQNKVLYRDNPYGEPNQMEDSLDMNSNDILNAKIINVQSVKLNGTFIVPDGVAEALPASSLPIDDAGGYFTTAYVESALQELGKRTTNYVNVKDNFGAVADGVTDDSAAFQAAHDSVFAGTIEVPDGTYNLASTITITKNNISFICKGRKAILTRSTDYGDTIFVTGNDATGVRISDFRISGITFRNTGLVTSGSHLHINGATRVWIQDIYVLQGFNGFDFQGVTAMYIDRVYLTNTNLFGGSATNRHFMYFRSCAATYAHPSPGDVFVSNFNLRGNTSGNATAYGLRIDSGDGIWFSNGHIGNTTLANIYLNASDATEHIGVLFFNNVMTDEGIGASVLFNGSSSLGRSIQFSNCLIKGAALGTYGVIANTGCTFNNVQFNNCVITEFVQHGVYMASAAATNWMFNDCQVRGNSYTSVNTWDGYNITAGDRIQIVGGQSGGHNNLPNGTKSQRYGIAVGASATNVIINDIDLRYNATQSLSVSPTALATASIGNTIKLEESATIASASTLVLRDAGDAFFITGTTTINNINLSWPGRRATLIFSGALSMPDAGNLRLNGALSTSANTVLQVIHDGTLWYEVSRSVN